MTRVHWRTDPDHPDGHPVPYTAEEEAQADRDVAARAQAVQAVEAEREAVLALLDDPGVSVQELAAVVKRLLERG